ncbi:MAG: hypothetical protein JKY99_01060, partial [Rhizobiales bacterium]|nr:hypothetical protein [Hyphomicrobiales bacterium]
DALPASITSAQEDGYGRMVITFKGENLIPPYTSTSSNNVLVLEFESSIQANIDSVAVNLRKYIGVARRDPDGRGLRFSLTRGTRINLKEAGEKLFVDFLPSNWQGLPPALPEDVVRALAERAERAFKAARAAEEANQGGKLRPRIALRVGRHPTFTRFSFAWNVAFNAAFVRDGQNVAINFDQLAPLDLSAIMADLPKGIEHAESFELDGKLNVVLAVSDEANIRAFRDGDVYVIDVTAPREQSEVFTIPDSAGRKSTTILGGDLTQSMPKAPSGARQVTQANGVLTKQVQQEMQTAVGANSGQATVMRSLAEFMLEPDNYAEGGAGGAGVGAEVNTAKQTPMAEKSEALPKPVPEANAAANAGKAKSKLLVDARLNDNAASFTFPYQENISAALFRRGNSIWMIFDSALPLELSLARAVATGLNAQLLEVSIPGATAIRMVLPQPYFTQLLKRETGWMVTVGDTLFEPGNALVLKSVVDQAGKAQIKAHLPATGAIHRVPDVFAGDVMFVVTSFGPPLGLIRDQRFTELQFFASAHGLAGHAYVDDLSITPKGDHLLIGREQGLALSSKDSSRGFKMRVSLLDEKSGNSERKILAERLFESSVEPGTEFLRVSSQLSRKITFAPEDERAAVRLDVARFYLANGMPHEANGMLKLAFIEDPRIANKPEIMLLQAAALTLAQRPKDAWKVLSHPRLVDDADGAFWKTMAANDKMDWEAAYGASKRGRAVLGAYPEQVQHRFLLSGARSALEYNDRAYSDSLLSEINPATLSQKHLGNYLVLRGRISKEAGDNEQAIRSWGQAKDLGLRSVSAEADMLILTHQAAEGSLSRDELVKELSGLSLRWRGDEIELRSLRLLSELYAENGQYRESFQAMKMAVLVDQGSDTTRALQDDISSRFDDLFLHGGASALEPVEALALYYDFRELTPIGPKGDEMVRKLASRLIDVDLLAQATELLAHQVDNRLRGTARAQIAADLAFVQILNGEPNLALQAIQRTRQAQLPSLLDRQRRLLEAKALADTGKPELAVSLLGSLVGSDVDRLVADIYWDSKSWQKAAESYELVAGSLWNEPGPLEPMERLDVLKAGIGYSLAEDELGLQRLRSHFAAKMGDTDDASAFDVVTSPLDQHGFEFRSVSRQLTEADTMRSFLSDYRRRYLAPADVAQAGRPNANNNPAEAARQNGDGLAVDGAV